MLEERNWKYIVKSGNSYNYTFIQWYNTLKVDCDKLTIYLGHPRKTTETSFYKEL